MRDVERLVTETAIRTPAFRLVKAGETVSGYTTDLSWRPEPFAGTANVDRVLDEFDRGATIVLQALHHSWLPLARFCRDLEATLGHAAQANAYYTPRDSQGLPVHHDTHDVFVLQVSGEKRWLVYEPVLELPLKHQRYSASLGDPGDPVLDVVAGPATRSTCRAAGSTRRSRPTPTRSTSPSGSTSSTWLDAVRDALVELESELALPPLDRRGEPEGLLDLLAERLEPELVRARARARLVALAPGGAGRPARRAAGLAVAHRRDAARAARRRCSPTSTGTTLVFEGKRLRFPERLRDELEFVLEAEDGCSPRRAARRARRRGPARARQPARAEGFLRRSCRRTAEPGGRARQVRELPVAPLDRDLQTSPVRRASNRTRQPPPSGSVAASRRSSSPCRPVASRIARSAACTGNE